MKFIQLLTALALVATSSVANASQVSHDKSCKQGEEDAKRPPPTMQSGGAALSPRPTPGRHNRQLKGSH